MNCMALHTCVAPGRCMQCCNCVFKLLRSQHCERAPSPRDQPCISRNGKRPELALAHCCNSVTATRCFEFRTDTRLPQTPLARRSVSELDSSAVTMTALCGETQLRSLAARSIIVPRIPTHRCSRPWPSEQATHARKARNICTAVHANGSKVVGLGSVGMDYLAQVVNFPKPDEKIRTTNMETRGGGNCANALTAAARLGLNPYLVSQVGDDGVGEEIEDELHADGVHTDFLLKAKNHPSPFTYIIVDKTGGTRTCIHTPGAAYSPQDLAPKAIAAILEEAVLVYFDGRLTESALKLARAAREKRVPVLVEAERLRPTLEQLLQEADYVSTSAHFPQQWTGEEALGDALLTTLQRLPNVKWMATTLGKRGSILIERSTAEPADKHVLDEVLSSMLHEVSDGASSSRTDTGSNGSGECGCVSPSGVAIRAGAVAATPEPMKLLYKRSPDQAAAAAAAAERAASKEASANASPDNISGYGHSNSDAAEPADYLVANITVASSAIVAKEEVQDTTGAGDAFLGTLLYGIANNMPHADMMKLAAVVAASKCTALGARPGLPYATDIKGLLAQNTVASK